jgi:hypothetical protein
LGRLLLSDLVTDVWLCLLIAHLQPLAINSPLSIACRTLR